MVGATSSERLLKFLISNEVVVPVSAIDLWFLMTTSGQGRFRRD